MDVICERLGISNAKEVESDEKFPILDLPCEVTARVIEYLDFPTRIAVRSSCRQLARAESLARLHVEEMALYKTGRKAFALSIKDKHSPTWKLVWKNGKNIREWFERSNKSLAMMKSQHLKFRRASTPLGAMAPILQGYLNRSTIGTLIIDGFHCTDHSMVELCRLLRAKAINCFRMSAPYSTTSDSQLFELFHNLPKLRSATFAVHRCTRKDVVLEKDFLLLAVSRLDTFIVHSRALQALHDEDYSVLDDDLLKRLLSDKCSRLDLLFYTPLLTPRGIADAVELLSARNQKARFSAYFRSELHDAVWRHLGLIVDAHGILSEDRDVTVLQNEDYCLARLGPHLDVKVVRRIDARFKPSDEYHKIIVQATEKPPPSPSFVSAHLKKLLELINNM